ncbi:hypothetical protein SLEP1_g14047 [Rubroshorea leprosula]|uniref:Hexosyltransferase n=1 Tax=Rubroshorea leprosula TaxID=152421 RepID=A0AAV5IRV6_9ROSI|nr:hypothetical protein SLEP1_g14047 [Rubroshorea leprosula]
MASNIKRTEWSKPNAGTAVTSSAKAEGQPGRAYVTILAGNGDDVKGVTGLAKGLKKVESKYKLVAAVLPDVPQQHRKALQDLECIVKEIEPVNPLKDQTQLAMASHTDINYPELQLINLKKYSKLRLWQEMFRCTPTSTIFFNVNDGYIYAPHLPWLEFLKLPTEFGIPQPTYYFNASMFVFVPGASIFDDLLETIASIPMIPFAEQVM